MIQQHADGAGERRHQIYPLLTPIQVEAARRFASGPPRYFAAGEIVFATGGRSAPVWLVLDGSIDVLRRDGLDEETPVTTHCAGQFTGEVACPPERSSEWLEVATDLGRMPSANCDRL